MVRRERRKILMKIMIDDDCGDGDGDDDDDDGDD